MYIHVHEFFSFPPEMVFSNGCRAPPWRQVLGDIAYITASPVDGAPLCLTASTEGYYVNKVSYM